MHSNKAIVLSPRVHYKALTIKGKISQHQKWEERKKKKNREKEKQTSGDYYMFS